MRPWRVHLLIIAPLIALFILHTMATYWHWYYFFWGFDTPMHLFGGAAAGWVTAHLSRVFAIDISVQGKRLAWSPIIVAVLAAAVVGIGWEWYEFFKDAVFATVTQPSIGDTMLDLALDMLGGILGGLLAYDTRHTT